MAYQPGSSLSRISGGAFDDPATVFGGGGSDQPDRNLARFLQTLGVQIPGGFSARKFGKGTLLADLLGQLNAPTGLEGLYGEDFEDRAIGTTVERTAAPFQEAARALASSYLRTGAGGAGQLAAGRERLAREQARTTGSSIADLLMGLEEARAGITERGEAIRTSRQSILANFLNALMSQQFQRDALRSQRSMAREQNVQSGISATIGAII